MKKLNYYLGTGLLIGITLLSACKKKENINITQPNTLEAKTEELSLRMQELTNKFSNPAGYIVQNGDNLWNISKELWSYYHNGVKSDFAKGSIESKGAYLIWEQLWDYVQYNPENKSPRNPDKLIPGEKLKFIQ